MKSLLLLRHAKSDWGDPGLADFDRPLNARGRDAAPKIGRYISDHDLEPDLVCCSTAKRAQQTWSLVAAALAHQPPVEHRDDLYLAPPDTLLEAVKNTPDRVQRVMILAHNPGLHDFACALAKTAHDRNERQELEQGMPTAALAVFTFAADHWAEICDATLERFIRPKAL